VGATPCRKCNRPVTGDRPKCLYCGALTQPVVCGQCTREVPGQLAACPYCRHPLRAPSAAPAAGAPRSQPDTPAGRGAWFRAEGDRLLDEGKVVAALRCYDEAMLIDPKDAAAQAGRLAAMKRLGGR